MNFLLSPLVKYGLIALATAGIIFGIYYAGGQRVQAKWDLAKQEIKEKIVIQKVIEEKITEKIVVQYVDKIKVVKEKGDIIYVKVPEYITAEDNAACNIRNGFVRLWNDAITQTISGPANETDRADAGISLTQVAENHTINTTTCLIYKERALAWEQWAKDQKESNK